MQHCDAYVKGSKRGESYVVTLIFFVGAHSSLQRDPRNIAGHPSELKRQGLEFRKTEVIRFWMAEFQRERYYAR